MLVTANTTLTANYNSFVPNPVGEVAITMQNGRVVWAMTNLSGNGAFANNISDYGCMFQWGYGNAIPNSASAVTMPHSTAQSGDVWPESEDPCPTGWRLPTGFELSWLINGTYTTTSWADTADGSSNDGLSIKPKAGDTSKTLFLPHAGFTWEPSTNANSGRNYVRGSWGSYWASSTTSADANASRLLFNAGNDAGWFEAGIPKLRGFSARCVR